MEHYSLNALLARMKHITRWALMHSTRTETLSEHTADTALLAHTLGLIAQDMLGQAGVRPETLAAAALYHDAPEILTGDMPTPVKYKNEALKTAYKALERQSACQMATLAAPPLRDTLAGFLTGDCLTAEEKTLLKAADRLSALIKCGEEVRAGNGEFRAALAQQQAALEGMNCPAAAYFMAHMLPCYALTLDELTALE